MCQCKCCCFVVCFSSVMKLTLFEEEQLIQKWQEILGASNEVVVSVIFCLTFITFPPSNCFVSGKTANRKQQCDLGRHTRRTRALISSLYRCDLSCLCQGGSGGKVHHEQRPGDQSGSKQWASLHSLYFT